MLHVAKKTSQPALPGLKNEIVKFAASKFGVDYTSSQRAAGDVSRICGGIQGALRKQGKCI
jgi:hypothetical protein